MKVAVCLLLFLCAFQADILNGHGRLFDRLRQGGHGGGQVTRCRSHYGRFHHHRHGHDPCVDINQGGDTNVIGNVETSSPSTGIRRPEDNRYGNAESYSQATGARRPEYNGNGYGNVEPYSQATGARRPEYNRNGDLETSSPSTRGSGQLGNTNDTVVPVQGRRIIQVGSNCAEGYSSDSRGNCREDF